MNWNGHKMTTFYTKCIEINQNTLKWSKFIKNFIEKLQIVILVRQEVQTKIFWKYWLKRAEICKYGLDIIYTFPFFSFGRRICYMLGYYNMGRPWLGEPWYLEEIVTIIRLNFPIWAPTLNPERYLPIPPNHSEEHHKGWANNQFCRILAEYCPTVCARARPRFQEVWLSILLLNHEINCSVVHR